MSNFGCCNGCGKKYGLLSRESDCSNCGLTFCTKCVDQKIEVTKDKSGASSAGKRRVCVRCYKILTGEIQDTQKRDISPPANFLRNLEATKQKLSGHSAGHHPGHGGTTTQKPAVKSDPRVKGQLKPQYRALSTDEMEIAERLEKLKQDRKTLDLGSHPLPPIQDVEERLAKLKGTASEPKPASSLPPTTKKLTAQEETDQLLEEICAEVEIDEKFSHAGDKNAPSQHNQATGDSMTSGDERTRSDDIEQLVAQTAAELEMDAQKALEDLKKDKDIMARLEELKRARKSKSDNNKPELSTSAEEEYGGDDSDEESESEQIKKILQQALEERKLDEELEKEGGFKPPLRSRKSLEDPTSVIPEPDELPWCCICNEDAVIRCLDCDNDLYCRSCDRNAHQDLYDEDHRRIPYKKPPNSTVAD